MRLKIAKETLMTISIKYMVFSIWYGEKCKNMAKITARSRLLAGPARETRISSFFWVFKVIRIDRDWFSPADGR